MEQAPAMLLPTKQSEREREGKRDPLLHYLEKKPLESSRSTGSGGNGGDVKLRVASTMAAARKLGFCEGDGCGFGLGFQGSRGRCFYRPGLGLGVRATPSRGARRGALGL